MLWLLVFLSLPRNDPVVRDIVDITEVNHVMNEVGNENLAQIVWWNWSRWDEEYRVVDWRMLDNTNRPVPCGEAFVTLWFDDKTKVFRSVESRVFRERWTLYDVETEDQKVLPEKRRRGLTCPRALVLQNSNLQVDDHESVRTQQ